MSQPALGPEHPADAVATAVSPEGGVLGSGRLRVSQRDLEMYAALVGVPHTLLLSADPPASVPAPRVDPSRLASWVRGLSRQARQQFRQAKVRLARPARRPRV